MHLNLLNVQTPKQQKCCLFSFSISFHLFFYLQNDSLCKAWLLIVYSSSSHYSVRNFYSTCVVSLTSARLSFKSVSTLDPSRDEALICCERSRIQGSLLCLMSSECTEISVHWEPSYPWPPHPPPSRPQSWNMVISHSCCVKLVFLCLCV